ncbi:MAG: CoA transferase [Calditrichaeota bacterium]|nr:MAG: CoA transferase [Calditrichota bacterium]
MLKDLVVLELAGVLAGPAVGMFFAELGATVIKVENPETLGDVTRSWKLPSEKRDSDISAYFSAVNWGKRSIAVNARLPEGRGVLHDLVRRADLVIASYKPGDAEKLHMDYATLSSLNPRLIYGHITGFGEEDSRMAYDAILQAVTGFMYMNGSPDGPPTKMPVALIDVLAAHQLKEGLLLALLRRERTGEGSYVHVSLFDAGVASLANQAANYLVAGEIPRRMGSEHPNIAPYGSIFTTRDGKPVVLAVGTDSQFRSLCEVLGRPELAALPMYSTNPRRVQNREKLSRLLGERIELFDRESLLKQLHARGVPAAAVLDMREVFEQPAAQALLVEASHNQDKPLRGVRTAIFRSPQLGNPLPLAPPPHLNQHSEEILRDLLQYREPHITDLKRQGALLWI